MNLTGVSHIHIRFSDSATDATKNFHPPRAWQQRYSVVHACGFSRASPQLLIQAWALGHMGSVSTIRVERVGKDRKEKLQSYRDLGKRKTRVSLMAQPQGSAQSLLLFLDNRGTSVSRSLS